MTASVQKATEILKSFGFEKQEITGMLAKIHGTDSCVFEKRGIKIITKINGFHSNVTDENIIRHIVIEVVNGYTKHLHK